ncbi:unnamed protein product [Acanthoscelides obtectus]|uniref:Gag protein n=1 Tax=Acanthoscelides obtectus TaxID=200917 RepID=A0A9P0M8R0_ACAOB|nr:unnamed protein product [Acanthoscelides obtectus]CAK1680761.1 Retrovirus-related Gag polyprotein from transposon HMS-Beagle [Acanthoscelides obtectus]
MPFYHSDSESDQSDSERRREFALDSPVMTSEISNLELSLAKDIVPDYFGGTKDLLDFITKGDQFIQLLKKTDPNCVFNKLLLHNIIAKIKGEARDLLNNSSWVTWKDVKDILINRFGDRRNESCLAYELSRMHQLNKESYQQYYDRINEQLQKILQQVKLNSSPELFQIKSDMYNDQALKRFIFGLKDQYGNIFAHSHVGTLPDALHKIQEMESFWYERSLTNFMRDKDEPQRKNSILPKSLPNHKDNTFNNNFQNQFRPQFQMSPPRIGPPRPNSLPPRPNYGTRPFPYTTQPQLMPNRSQNSNQQISRNPQPNRPTPMSVDGSSYRPNTSVRQSYRPNFFQQTGRPNVIVKELHNQETEGTESHDQCDNDYFSETAYGYQQDNDYLDSGVVTFENDDAQAENFPIAASEMNQST